MTIRHWIVFIGVFAPAFGGLTLWMGQRDNTISLPVNTATPIASAEMPPTEVPPAKVPAGFTTGSWTETLQGQYGLVEAHYEIRGPGAEKIGTQLEYLDEREGHEIIFRNITQNPVHLIYIATWTDIKSGQLTDNLVIDIILNPKEENFLKASRLRASDKIEATALKIIAEIN